MACVAFGLWWQYQYIASSVRQSVAETVWRDLENEGHSVLFSPRDPEPIATLTRRTIRIWGACRSGSR